MKQRQFEDLLFADKKLSSSDTKEIQRFVRENPESAFLQKNWLAVQTQLALASQSAPAQGFTDRWRIRQLADQHRIAQIQSFCAISVSAISAATTAYVAIGSSRSIVHILKDFFIAAANQLLEMISFLQIVYRVAFSILQKFPPSWWASIAMVLVLLPMLWFVVYRELITSKGVQL